MRSLDQALQQQLASLREAGLHRGLRRVDSPQAPHMTVDGRPLLNFSSNDYLGLANHPAVKGAAEKAAEDFGGGSGASRLICGSLAPHHELEAALAEFKGTEAALSFSSGYATALGSIPAFVGREDVIILDRLAHACLVDAARLSGAKLRVFAHNDLNDLERKLKWASEVQTSKFKVRGSRLRPHVLVVTESLFSMDGDQAPLKELVEIKDRFGAWLMLDEAHATGLYGEHRRGLAEAWGVARRVEIQMGTLGKALGASGGYIAGSRTMIDFLINRARSFIFSTAPVPAASAAASAAIRLARSREGEARCQQLWRRVLQCRTGVSPVLSGLREAAFPKAGKPAAVAPKGDRRDARPTLSAILPLIVGAEARAVALAAALQERGIFVPAIRYPTVARGQARLRISVTAAHTEADVEALVSALEFAGGAGSVKRKA